MDSGGLNLISIDEFVEQGYLQEVNRLFFHPLGLSLLVKYDEEDRAFKLGGVLDCREDAEGVIFGSSKDSNQSFLREKKYSSVNREKEKRSSVRLNNFGWEVQPISDMTRLDSHEEGGLGN